MKFENVEVYGIPYAIRGMRNPMLSHGRSDSKTQDGEFILGSNDAELAASLIKAGTEHRKFLRQIFVHVDLVKFPAYWLQELQTYKIGTTLDCSSTMHKITSRPLTQDDFASPETAAEGAMLPSVITALNDIRDSYVAERDHGKRECLFRSIKHLLPSSYLYERATWTANYEVLANLHRQRKDHRLPEWRQFCEEFIEGLPFAKEFIVTAGVNQ